MLRRPPTILHLTQADLASYETRRAQRSASLLAPTLEATASTRRQDASSARRRDPVPAAPASASISDEDEDEEEDDDDDEELDDSMAHARPRDMSMDLDGAADQSGARRGVRKGRVRRGEEEDRAAAQAAQQAQAQAVQQARTRESERRARVMGRGESGTVSRRGR